MGSGQLGEGKDGDGEGPGRGGINRGRGDAPLIFGDEKIAEGTNFDQKDLMNKYLNPEDLIDMGITTIAPEPDPGKFSPGALRSFDQQSGSAVSRSRISPSQKNVVSKYFSE